MAPENKLFYIKQINNLKHTNIQNVYSSTVQHGDQSVKLPLRANHCKLNVTR